MSDYGRIGSADPATHERSRVAPSPPSRVGVRCAASFTIADVLAWAKTRAADQRYDYTDPDNCALCQFLRDTGRAAEPSVNPINWRDGASGKQFPIDKRLDLEALNAADETFGGLVARLEKLCPDAPVPPSEWTRLDAYMNDVVVL